MCFYLLAFHKADLLDVQVLLVKGWKSPTWTFPKGKINQDEAELMCAVREVHEETGYDCGPILERTSRPDGSNNDYIDVNLKDSHKVRLYVAPGVEEAFPFKTLTRKEISKIGWLPLDQLPSSKNGSVIAAKEERTPAGQKFYHVAPFVKPLKDWIKAKRANHPMRPPQFGALAEVDREWTVDPNAASSLAPALFHADAGEDPSYESAIDEPNSSSYHSTTSPPHLLNTILGNPVSTSTAQPPPLPRLCKPSLPPRAPATSQPMPSLSPPGPCSFAPQSESRPNSLPLSQLPAPMTLVPTTVASQLQSRPQPQPEARSQSQTLLGLVPGYSPTTQAQSIGHPSVPLAPGHHAGPASPGRPSASSQAQALLGILSPPSTTAAPEVRHSVPLAPPSSQAQALLGILSPPSALPTSTAAAPPYFLQQSQSALPAAQAQAYPQFLAQPHPGPGEHTRSLLRVLHGDPHVPAPPPAPVPAQPFPRASPAQQPSQPSLSPHHQTQPQPQPQTLLDVLMAQPPGPGPGLGPDPSLGPGAASQYQPHLQPSPEPQPAPQPEALPRPLPQSQPEADGLHVHSAPASQQQALLGLLSPRSVNGAGEPPGQGQAQAQAQAQAPQAQGLLRALLGPR